MKLFLSSIAVLLSLNGFSATGPTQLDDLILGEMAAVKSYNQILEDVENKEERSKLEKIRNNHEVALSKLKTFANKDVKDNTKSAGVWGSFAEAWTGGAKIMGNKTALKALSQGERHGMKEYKEALDNETIKLELKQMIKTQFLPKQEEHLETLKSFM